MYRGSCLCGAVAFEVEGEGKFLRIDLVMTDGELPRRKPARQVEPECAKLQEVAVALEQQCCLVSR